MQTAPIVKEKRLLDPISKLKGIGIVKEEALNRIGIYTIQDLLFYAPYKYISRSSSSNIKDLKVNENVEVFGIIDKTEFRRLKDRRVFIAYLRVFDGEIKLIWFNPHRYINKYVDRGVFLSASGTLKFYRGKLQIVHPKIKTFGKRKVPKDSLFVEEKEELIPLYNTTSEMKRIGLDSEGLREVIYDAIYKYGDYIKTPNIDYKRYGILSLKDAILRIHKPESVDDFELARKSLAFYELFAFELYIEIIKSSIKNTKKGISFVDDGYTQEFIRGLPFELTGAQKRAIKDIIGDMTSNRIMNRLLQGDVGSGKTVVAAVASYLAIRNGYQVAFMAPTEILAKQHYNTIASLFGKYGIRVALLLGSQTAKEKYSIYESLSYGVIDIVISTHALFQDKVKFSKLGLIVVDEQHRFGVKQRMALRQKGLLADFLMMTATPIPRTLVMTMYGDMDLSIIDELPPGRKPVRTFVRRPNRRSKIYDFLEDRIKKGDQVFIVYPLIERSEVLNISSIEENIEALKKRFKDFEIGVIHGKLPPHEKDIIMNRFREGKLHILVATTVIETGIDVPNASIMVIENAERFGLSQLHQLRGRVGRSNKESYCILIASNNVSKEAWMRLKIMEKYSDGFKIADEDMKMRGPGEILGAKQSGVPEFRFADVFEDGALWRLAKRLSKEYLKTYGKEDEFLKNILNQIKQEKGFLYLS